MINETIPVYKFWESNYPNLDPDFNGEPLPEFYGEKTNISPICIDTSIMQYKIAYRKIKAIDAVEADGLDLEEDENYETDLDNAQFIVYGMPLCLANSDYYLVIQAEAMGINGVDYVELAGDSTAGYVSGGGQYYAIDGANNWVADAGVDLCFLVYGKKTLDGDEELVTGLNKSHYDTDYPLRDAGARSKLAQGFRMPGDNYYITRVILWTKKTGAPTGNNFRVSIYEDDQETRVGGYTERKDVSEFNAAITLLQNKYYQFTSESDIRVDAKGYVDNFNNLINTHAGMLEHLWTTIMGRDPDLLDSDSFTDLKTARPEPVCEYFNYEVSFSTIVTNLEAGGLFKFLPGLDGKWYIPFYEAGVSSGITHLKDEDFLSFKCLRDAHSIHYKVQIQYNRDPNDKYKVREATSDVARYLYKRKGTLPLETYLKDGDDAQDRANTYISLIEVPQRKAIYEVSGYAFDAIPTEKVLITRERADAVGGAFDATIFRQLKLTKRISTGTVNVEALLDELSY